MVERSSPGAHRSEIRLHAAMRRRQGYIAEGLLVIVLALSFGVGLAAVHVFLSPIIAANKENETRSVIPRLVPGAAAEASERLEVAGADGKPYQVYRAAAGDGSLKGWIVLAKGQGFADEIELVIGVDRACEKLTGIFVLAQKETPGLGNYIESGPRFTDQFPGKPTGTPLQVQKEKQSLDHHVKPVTGATISSESVCAIINQAMASLRSELARRAEEAESAP